jgi:hypothetical protein
MGFLERAPWHGYDAPGLHPSGFCARRMSLRPCRRLQPSLFLVRQGILASEGQRLNYDGTLRSLFALLRASMGAIASVCSPGSI